MALGRVGPPSVLSPIILSSRVSLTNVARSSDPSPIQHDQGHPAVGGVATSPLAYPQCSLPLAPCFALRLICDASRDSNRSACRIDRCLPPSARRRSSTSCLCASDGTNAYRAPERSCSVTTSSTRVSFPVEQNCRLSPSARASVNLATDCLAARRPCPAKRRSRCPWCPRRIWSWKARGAVPRRQSCFCRRKTGNRVAG